MTAGGFVIIDRLAKFCPQGRMYWWSVLTFLQFSFQTCFMAPVQWDSTTMWIAILSSQDLQFINTTLELFWWCGNSKWHPQPSVSTKYCPECRQEAGAVVQCLIPRYAHVAIHPFGRSSRNFHNLLVLQSLLWLSSCRIAASLAQFIKMDQVNICRFPLGFFYWIELYLNFRTLNFRAYLRLQFVRYKS